MTRAARIAVEIGSSPIGFIIYVALAAGTILTGCITLLLTRDPSGGTVTIFLGAVTTLAGLVVKSSHEFYADFVAGKDNTPDEHL